MLLGRNRSVHACAQMCQIEVALKRIPLRGNLGIKARQVRLYEMTPDAHPIIGSTLVEVFYLLTGFLGYGFM